MSLKIAWQSNAPWVGSGYGVMTAEITPLLKAAGHDVTILANFGLTGATMEWGGMKVLPGGIDAYSNDLHPAAIANIIGEDRDRGLGITLFDVWVMKNPEWDNVPLLSWTPVDHNPAPPEVLQFFKRGGQKWALAMSRFGEQMLLEGGIARERVLYAPHSYNPEIFKPEGTDMRADMKLPKDAHVTMINAANKGNTPIRKCFPEQLYAWSRFAEKHDDAYLYLHTEISGIANGVNIAKLLEIVKAPKDRVRIVPQFEYRMGIDNLTVARLYRSCDVLLAASRGGGFEIPLIEAQAIGRPVITTNWTAMPELVGAGWKIEGQIEFDVFQDAYWKVPAIDAIYEALEASYAAKGTEREAAMRKGAIEFVADYATPKVWEKHWTPVMAQMEAELKKMPKPGAINREQRRAAMRAKK